MTTTAPSPRTVGRRVNLLEIDPEMGRAVPEVDRDFARRLAFDAFLLETGGSAECTPGEWARIVAGGVLWREVRLGASSTPQLLGPGSVVHSAPDGLEVLPATEHVVALTPAALIVLDQRFITAAARWPAVGALLFSRLAEQRHDLAVHAAICMMPRVEDRILTFLWRLAERCGRVGPEGVRVPLRLTHERLGTFVGAQRPTVSLALTTLRARGLLDRSDDGSWLLLGEPQAAPAAVTNGGEPPGWIPRALDAVRGAREPTAQARELRQQAVHQRSRRT